MPIKRRQWRDRVHARRRRRARRRAAQINMVRVDGHSAVLMTVLKAGSASTLDVIDGVKALLPS